MISISIDNDNDIRFDHWNKLAFWPACHAVLLINGVDPIKLENELCDHHDDVRISLNIKDINSFLNDLKFIESDSQSLIEVDEEIVVTAEYAVDSIKSGDLLLYNNTDFKVTEFIAWARSKGLDIIPEFNSLDKDCINTSTHPFLDEAHPFYSPILKIAHEVWMALYVYNEIQVDSNGRPVGKSHKDQIKDWLTRNHPEIPRNSDTCSAICLVVNPNKAGGPPRTLAMDVTQKIKKKNATLKGELRLVKNKRE